MIIVIVVGMMPGMHPEIHHHYEVYISMYTYIHKLGYGGQR